MPGVKVFIGQRQIMFADVPENVITIPLAYTGTDVSSVGFAPGTTTTTDNWSNLFQNCTNLKNLDLSGLPAHKPVDLTGFIDNCPNLTNSSLENIANFYLSTSNVLDKNLTNTGLSSNQVNYIVNTTQWIDLQTSGWVTGLGV